MLVLRLARAGTKKKPVYHLVATDMRNRRDGKFIENLGYYIPGRKVLVLKEDRVTYWLGVGAQPSETAGQLLRRFKQHRGFGPVAEPKPAKKAAPAPEAAPAA